MAGDYKVVSLNPHCPSITKADHGSFPSYAAAAGVARILRRMNPIKTVLIEIPKLIKSDKIEFGVVKNNPDAYDFESEPFHW